MTSLPYDHLSGDHHMPRPYPLKGRSDAFAQILAWWLTFVTAAAAAPPATSLRIEQAWARETPPGATVGAAYLRIVNGGAADVLRGASTPIAKQVEMHSSTVENGVMRMRPVPELAVPAHQTVVFRPGTLHIMLIDLIRPLKAGERLHLTLLFRDAGPISVDAPVRGLDAGEPDGH
jgi:copper(I)-binding protein